MKIAHVEWVAYVEGRNTLEKYIVYIRLKYGEKEEFQSFEGTQVFAR